MATKLSRRELREMNEGINCGRYFALAGRLDAERFKPAVWLEEDNPSAWPEPGDNGVIVAEERGYKTRNGVHTWTAYTWYSEVYPRVYSTSGRTFRDAGFFEWARVA